MTMACAGFELYLSLFFLFFFGSSMFTMGYCATPFFFMFPPLIVRPAEKAYSYVETWIDAKAAESYSLLLMPVVSAAPITGTDFDYL